MADLSVAEQQILKAMKELGADKESGLKSVDDISRKANRPKGLVLNALSSLAKRNMVKRVSKDKSARYYATKGA
ncbi:MAG: transcriptional regulator [Candidatus Micrarchaeota archaeon]|nr:transcriptional regulator [Candidatus Micrarchaeota archaeon]